MYYQDTRYSDFELNERGHAVEAQNRHRYRQNSSRAQNSESNTMYRYYPDGSESTLHGHDSREALGYNGTGSESRTRLVGANQNKRLPELPSQGQRPVVNHLTNIGSNGISYHNQGEDGSNLVMYPPAQAPGMLGMHSRPSMSRDMSFNGNSYKHPDDQIVVESSEVPPAGRFPRRLRINSKAWWRKRHPWFVWTMSLVQVCVFIAELAKMGELTGSPIQTEPSFNPMIGPSSYVMINMGARFTPCMHEIPNVTDATNLIFPCPNSTDLSTDHCSLQQLCGFGHEGLSNPTAPHQWWRFIVPIFLHAGFVHIGFNLLLQLRLGAELEKEIGIIRFVLVYLSSGIAGFILGGNFTPDGIASTGASGSLFGVIALDFLDLLFNWPIYQSPKRTLLLLVIEIIISFALGLLPGLDNFSHIGGFAMGLLTGTALLRSPLKIRQNANSPHSLHQVKTTDEQGLLTEDEMSSSGRGAGSKVANLGWSDLNPALFVGKSKWWYMWVGVRVICVGLAVAFYAGLITNFYSGSTNCTWCKYLSCLPVHGWCDQGRIST